MGQRRSQVFRKITEMTNAHWGNLMQLYTSGVLPQGFTERWIDCGPPSFQMIVRSQQVMKPSVPRI
jgi:hypothetical protein